MAQIIKKLQEGGSFTWNGETIDATEENIAKIAAISPEAALLAKSGQLKSLNPDGTIVTNTRVKGKDKRQIRKNLTQLRLLDFNNPAAAGNTTATSGSKPNSSKKYKLDVSSDINLTFDDEGRLLDTPEARRYKSRLRGYLNGWKGDKEYSDYDFGGRYHSIDDANSYWQDEKTQAHFADLDSVFDRIESGEATDQDIAYLKAAGINYGSDASRAAKKTSKKAISDLGMTEEMWNQAKDHVVYDAKTGLYTLSDNVKSALGLTDNGGYEFNDSWAKKMNNPRWNWLKGLSLVGGNLYKKDAEGVSSWRGNTDYDKLSKAYDIAGANNIYRTIWDDNELKAANAQSFDRNALYNEWFSSADRKNTVYNVLSGVKKATGFKGIDGTDMAWDDEHQIIKHWDKNDPSKVGYAIFDKYGKHIGDADESMIVADERNTYRDFSHGLDPNTTGTTSLIQDEGPYKGMMQTAVKAGVGSSGINLFTDPNNPNRAILDLGWDGKNGSAGKAFILPPEVAHIINNLSEDNKKLFLKNIASKPYLMRRFTRSLNDMTTSAWNEFWDWSDRADVEDYEEMGFSPEQARDIDNILRAYGDWTSNDEAGLNTLTVNGKKINVVGGFTGGAGKDYRKQLFLVDRYRQNTTPTVPINRHGGTIKAQAGAKIVNVGEVDDPSKAWGLGSGDNKSMSAADWTDLAALITDIAGLGISFVPGYSVAGAITGAVGSTAGFVSDITRDGFQWGDLGRYGINLGLDAATLIPVAGGLSKLGKIGKAVKNAAPLLIKGAAALGLGDAIINTIKKAVSGESFTINDARRIVQGFSGGLALHRTGLKTPGKKMGALRDADAFTIKSKDSSVANVRLNKKEIESVTSLTPDKQKEKLAEIVLEHVKKGNANTKLTKENVLDAFEAIPTARTRGELTWDPRKWTGEGYQFKAADNFDYNANIRTDRSKLGAWFHGDDPMRMAYNRYLRTGVVPGGNLRTKNGQFKSALWSAPVFNLPGLTSANGETDPRTYADVHVPVSVHKKGGKIKKCEYGGFASEEEEDAWYEGLNQEIEDEVQSDYMSGNLYGGENDISSTSYSNNKTYSFGPQTGWDKAKQYLNPELLGNFASLGINMGQNKAMYDSGVKANDLAAKAKLAEAKAEADAAKKSIGTFDNSANERQLAQAKSAIYSNVGQYTDPNMHRQMKKDQTSAYIKALDNFNTNTSANLGAYNKEVKAITDYNRGIENNFSGQALAIGFNQKAADEKLAAAKTTADMTSIDNMVRGLTTAATAARNEAIQANNSRTLAEGQINWNNTMVNRWNELRNSGVIDDDTAYKYQDDIEGYLKAYDSKWYSNNNALYQSDVASRLQSTNFFTPSFARKGNLPIMQSITRITKPQTEVVQKKRGGRLPVEDILWLEKNKNAAKTIAKLHEDVLKLLKVGK